MKKVLIYAYMEENLGDDLMVSLVCTRYPNVRFFLWAKESYKERFRRIKNLTVYSPDEKKVVRWNKIAEKLRPGKADVFQLLVKKTDALVHVGGSVYMQHDNYLMTYNLDMALRSMSKRMYTCGANFGPYTDEEYYRNYYELLKRYDGVCFRDRYSYQLFADLPHVHYAADLVFNLRESEKETPEQKKQVLMSVIQLKNRNGKFSLSQYTETYNQFMAGLAEQYMERGYQVKMVSFCSSQKDAEAAEDIIRLIKEPFKGRVSVYSYSMDIEECLRLFDESEIVVGTRFHSIILGWLKKKQVLPIVYDTKTMHLLEDNDYETYVTMEQMKDLDPATLVEKVQMLPEQRLQKLVQEAEGQFEELDKLLK